MRRRKFYTVLSGGNTDVEINLDKTKKGNYRMLSTIKAKSNFKPVRNN